MLSDKLLLKVAILERAEETRVLFLGTSRFLDAIAEQDFTDELEKLTGERIKSLNGATTGSQGERSAYFAKLAAENEGLTHVILEASPPALQDGELGFRDGSSPTLKVRDRADGRGVQKIENWLQEMATEHIGLVKYRKALRPKTVLKLPVLYLADTIDPNTWSRKGVLRGLFEKSDTEITDDYSSKYVPEVISKATLEGVPEAVGSNEVYDNMVRLSEIFAGSGIEVIWVATPVAKEKISKNSGGKYRRYYESISHRYDVPFYDYACLETDEEFLRDTTHLNASGRGVFTRLLARQLAGHFQPVSE
ncbi:MAG: hypothetical protein P8J87_12045 [Verrucomicrobiales bacterium]|nr:hypothetical protein [Verrucomicrobiales bacterium]